MFFHATSTDFFCEECAHLFWFFHEPLEIFSVKNVLICFDFWLCDLTSKQIWRKSTNKGAALQNKNKLPSPATKNQTNVQALHRKKTVNSYRKNCGGCMKKGQ